MAMQQLLKIVYALDIKVLGEVSVHVVCGECYYLITSFLYCF